MRRPVIALATLVMAAGSLSSCDSGGTSSSLSPHPAASGTPAVSGTPQTLRIFREGDKTLSIMFYVRGQGRAEVTYSVRAGDTPTRETVAVPWTHIVEVGVDEPDLSPVLTARNTDPNATAECQIGTSQLALSGGELPLVPGRTVRCAIDKVPSVR
ncbi:hypothetical protein [Actinoplanes sp. NPDC051859]|uniref:hypothetical protein n=1 Tax=Actinoplanes sp. NPDC051859 TaxID=3363909 RepID=UPI0037BDD130